MAMNGRIDKLWYIHTMEYYIVMRMNDLELHEIIWMDLPNNAEQKEARC